MVQCGRLTDIDAVDIAGIRLEVGDSDIDLRLDASAHRSILPFIGTEAVSDNCIPPGGLGFAQADTSYPLEMSSGAKFDEIAGMTVGGSLAAPFDEPLADVVVKPLSYEIGADGDIDVLVENRTAADTYEVDVVLYALDEDGLPLGYGGGFDDLVLGPGESGTVSVDNDFFRGTATTVRAVARLSLPRD